jgi:hypothetical protein
MVGQDRLAQLAADRFAGLPPSCGNAIDPGIVFAPDWRDWSGRDTSVDQARIEAWLDRFPLAGKRILHVGIGNSSLAREFAPRAREVVGISLDPPELARARELDLANYRAVARNKYADLGADIEGPFDFIVDNNITSACCCLSHLLALLQTYGERLAPGGQILTDREGLGWIPHAPGLNPRWRFSTEDLAAIGELAGLATEPIGQHLVVLSRGARSRPTPASRAASPLRRAREGLSRRFTRLWSRQSTR